jgi:PelA/Pel-15E family pectate lyase
MPDNLTQVSLVVIMVNSERRAIIKGSVGAFGLSLLGACGRGRERSDNPVARSVPDTMKHATEFMRERCACRGGYVWTMIWIQPPGTATVGHLFLDCFHATGDAYYYEAAGDVAAALIDAQHPAGGWNYLHDFAGEASTRRWYDTIGKNGWRLEEFHHYYGNATFDDSGTAEAAYFFLRLYLERREARYREPFERALGFVLDSQYDNGGWPQRFPFVEDRPVLHGRPDYTRHITFNDDVAAENIRFLLLVWQALGDQRALDAVRRAMNIFVMTQQPAPQAGWGLQHDAETLRPVGARSYEPDALAPQATAGNIALLLDFYEWTGAPRFLARLPEAFQWLESVRLEAAEVRMKGREFPTYVEIGTNRALYSHRRGSNVVNGEYYHDYDPSNPVTHNVQWRQVDLAGLRARYEMLQRSSKQALLEKSPLNRLRQFQLPGYFTTHMLDAPNPRYGDVNLPVEALVASLNDEGYWPTPLIFTSHPYRGDGPATPAPGDFAQTFVGDDFDTSPYQTSRPELGISTRAFVRNMATLMQVAESGPAE